MERGRKAGKYSKVCESHEGSEPARAYPRTKEKDKVRRKSMRDRKRKRAIQSIGLCNKYFAFCFCDVSGTGVYLFFVLIFFYMYPWNLVHRTPYGVQGFISSLNHKHPYLVGICLMSICFFFFNQVPSKIQYKKNSTYCMCIWIFVYIYGFDKCMFRG